MVLVLEPLDAQPEKVIELSTSQLPQLVRATELALTTDAIENTSELPGEPLTEALDSLAPATESEAGYLSRRVFVNAASSKVGTTFAGVVVEAAPAQWTDPSDIPEGGRCEAVCCGGGGGASGSTDSITGSSTAGAHSGAGGCWNPETFDRSDLVAALPIVFLVELGGLAGTCTVAAPAAANEGSVGGRALFGSLLSAYGGGGGGRPGQTNRARASGGGPLGPGTSGAALTAATSGGLPGTTARGQGKAGAGGLTTSTNAGSQCAENGGASGENTNVTAQGPGGDGARSLRGGGSGGSGANNGVGSVGQPGGTGGKSGDPDGTERGGGGTAGAAGAGVDGGSGGDGADGDATHAGDGGGGGGTGTGLASRGGGGGRGGFPGGGGGAAGASRNSVAALPSGPGGDPMIMLTFYR